MSCGTRVLVNNLSLSVRQNRGLFISALTSLIPRTPLKTDRMMKTIKSSIKPKSTYENIRPG